MLNEIGKLQAELRTAVDVLRPFAEAYQGSGASEVRLCELGNAETIVAAYDAQHPEGK